MIFVSTAVYALAKELGARDAVAEVHRQLEECTQAANGAKLREDILPAVRVITRLRLLDALSLHIDAGATCIGKTRARALHAFSQSAADVWISVDDDVDATMQTLRWLLEAARDDLTPRICLAPCLARGPRQEPTLTVQLPQIYIARPLSNGGCVRNATSGGFGLVATNRRALEHIEARAVALDLVYDDDDGVSRLAVFYDEISGRRWYGEDLSFFRRLPPQVVVEALATGHTGHDGAVLELGTVPELMGA